MLTKLGRAVHGGVVELLDITALPYAAVKAALLERRKSRRALLEGTLQQLYFTAVQPLPLFLTLGAVCGFVVTVISHRFLSVTPFAEHVPEVIARAVVLELTPLIIALVLIGRSGTAVSTELGYMRVNQQVDALRAAGVNVEYFLVLPRLLGITLATVSLTVAMAMAGLVGGVLFARLFGFMGVALRPFDLVAAVEPWLLGYAVLKALCSGLVIATVNCHFGLGVRRAYTEIPRANVQGAVRCYLACVGINALISIYVLVTATPLPTAPIP